MQQVVWNGFAHERSRSNTACEISLMQQLLVGAQYGQTGDAKVRGETAARWNPLSRTQPAIENGLAESVIDLSLNRDIDVTVDGEMQRAHCPRSALKVVMPLSTQMAMAKVPVARIFGESRTRIYSLSSEGASHERAGGNAFPHRRPAARPRRPSTPSRAHALE